MQVITVPHPTLRAKAATVTVAAMTTPAMQEFIHQLIRTMKEYRGIGIAAPQVDKSIRLIIVDTADGPQAFFNPRILWQSLTTAVDEEGCLSIPNTYGLVKRPRSIITSYHDTTGQRQRLRGRGLFARVLCHEIDHLNGVLFTDRMTKEVRHAL